MFWQKLMRRGEKWDQENEGSGVVFLELHLFNTYSQFSTAIKNFQKYFYEKSKGYKINSLFPVQQRDA